MSAAFGLDPLLAALREAGLPVGVAEVARLQQVFALGPRLEEDCRLKAVLRAVLVKSAEDCARFEPVFDAWVGRAGQEVSLRESLILEHPQSQAPLKAPLPPKRVLWRALALIAVLLLSLVFSNHGKNAQGTDERSGGDLPSTTKIRILTPAEIRTHTFTAWVPTLTVALAKPAWQGWPALTLSGLALLAAGALWFTLRRRSRMPELAPEPVKKGPPRVFLTPPDLAGPQLLEPREREALVWGIGHFVAEEPSRRLDLSATVQETAKAGGIPRLRFHQTRYPREVWLWIDEAADDPAIPRLAKEIEASLQANGLPIERAFFRGVPEWLVTSAGQSFAPNEVDERRDAVLVAILTDGRILARQYTADDRRVRLDALLRSLSHWPRLAFVDFAAEPGDLAAVLAKHSLVRIPPPNLASFLGSEETAKQKTRIAVSGDAAWAAACAVAPASVDELRAFQLRKRLGLTTSPWALRDLRAAAPGPPGRLQWRSQDRARLVNWLHVAEAQAGDGVAPGSLLGKALDFWEEVYDRELKDREAGSAAGSWLETPAHRHLAMERALLALWRHPSKAVKELYSLHGSALRELIERNLQEMAPADWGGPENLHLPWTWAELFDVERVMLQEMKLGGGMPLATLHRSGRFWLGLGLCLGLAMGALGAAALSGQRKPDGLPAILQGPGKPEEVWERVGPARNGNWFVAVGTHKSSVEQQVPSGTQVTVQWKEQSLPCVTKLKSGAEVWSCGTIENPPRLLQAPNRKVVVLATSPETLEADALAVDLLDSGSADQVILSSSWRRYASQTNQDVLVLPDSEWSQLRPALRFDGTRTVQQVWPNLRLLAGSPSVPLRGLPACRNGELLEEKGMTFVHVCPGTFTMGDEVTPSEYWIGRTEVTNAQYRRDHPDHQGSDTLPATGVSWKKAESFCERHGWRLPTESEWEYAARAGTQTPWSFGADERRIGEFAWFKGNSGEKAHPVATRRPNPWGIYDMHGNVWEWVAKTEGEERARGGGFGFPPTFLHSWVRIPSQPSVQVGFRCARSPYRQR